MRPETVLGLPGRTLPNAYVHRTMILRSSVTILDDNAAFRSVVAITP